MPAVLTGEDALSFAIGLIDHATERASSARVAWVDCGQRYPHKLGLVGQELAKLCETPRMQPVALTLSGPNPLANMRQIFDRNRKAVAFSRRNNLLTYTVVRLFSESSLLARELLKFSLCSLRAALLKTGAAFGITSANPLHGVSRVRRAETIEGQVHDPEINTKNTFNIDLFRVRNVTDAGEVPFAANEHQVNFAPAEGEQLALPFTADETNFLAAGKRPDRNGIVRLKAQDAIVKWLRGIFAKGDSGGLASVGFMCRVGVCDLRDTAHRDLRRNVEAAAQVGVG